MAGKTVPLGNYMVGGVAFAGRYGISRVQVSVDEGKTWADASVKAPLSKWAWSSVGVRLETSPIRPVRHTGAGDR